MARAAPSSGRRGLLGLTLLVLLGQLVVSRLCNSLIIAVDSFHTLHLLLQLGVRLWDPARPWRRLQPLGGLVAALLLASLCASVSLDILGHFLQPHAGQRPCLALAAGATGVLLNAGVLAAGCVDGWDASEGSLASAGRGGEAELPVQRSEATGGEDAECAGCPPNPAGAALELPPLELLLYCNPGASCTLLKAQPSPVSRGQLDRDSGEPAGAPHSHDSSAAGQQPGPGERPGRWAGRGGSRGAPWVLGAARGLLAPVLVLANGLTQLLLTPGCQGQRSEGGCRLYVYLDPAFSLAAVLVLLAGALPQLKRHGLLLLQAVPAHIAPRSLAARIGRVPGVLAVHDLHVWQLSEACLVASVHVHCAAAAGIPELVSGVTAVLRGVGVSRCTVQPEAGALPPGRGQPPPPCSLACGKECANKLCCQGGAAPPAGHGAPSQQLVMENPYLSALRPERDSLGDFSQPFSLTAQQGSVAVLPAHCCE
ncbi:proton-coupled zinc antiporter SLC30A1 [Lepisosteus oculatus]|uniref:proton-coupled zinc antiporter SLC30A1 n=1 Tax=Lepisosteus oculatus TaxID=7918 RepID=UPI003724A476